MISGTHLEVFDNLFIIITVFVIF